MRLERHLYLLAIILRHSFVVRALSTAMPSKRKTADSSSGILMILSPAKTLDLSPCDRRLFGDWTPPDCDAAKTKEVATILKKNKASDLAKLLGISANLAKTAHEVR